LNRVASSSSVNGVKPAINEIAYWQQLIGMLQFPPYVWIGMVILAAGGLCYSLMLHTRAELDRAILERERTLAQVRQLEVENRRLSLDLEAVEKDPRTIELLARQAGMVGVGESVVLIKDGKKNLRSSEPITKNLPER
jgi:hypothetical protein